ncbi:MAG: c-type cytochrome domain-containing protein [Gallionellaceae bacterium]
MKTKFLLGGAILAGLSFPVLGENKKEVSFSKDIHPIINDYCLSCHQPGGKGYEKSGLDLRTYESMMKGTRYGAVIKPGDSFASTLIMLVEGRADPSIKMPFGINGNLSKDKIDLFKKWIDQGAKNN